MSVEAIHNSLAMIVNVYGQLLETQKAQYQMHIEQLNHKIKELEEQKKKLELDNKHLARG